MNKCHAFRRFVIIEAGKGVHNYVAPNKLTHLQAALVLLLYPVSDVCLSCLGGRVLGGGFASISCEETLVSREKVEYDECDNDSKDAAHRVEDYSDQNLDDINSQG